MTKPERKQQLRKDIVQLEQSKDRLHKYLLDNIDATNYDEVAREKRAIGVTIETKERQIAEMDSQRGAGTLECKVYIPLGFRYARP